MNYFEESLKLHEKYTGKIEVKSKVKIAIREDLSLAYTPDAGTQGSQSKDWTLCWYAA